LKFPISVLVSDLAEQNTFFVVGKNGVFVFTVTILIGIHQDIVGLGTAMRLAPSSFSISVPLGRVGS
jgi:hypothetical protein